ncbi:hypothetical protein RDI58_002281 [Solanum bulbocastanum]|uniref:Uncharacterized protein n=1 Tax=Solanum bulbocastanum TaxID=147425 RepID=A0AAN8YU06_SOLBU
MSMDLILASKKADKTIIEVEGVGGYYAWSSSQFPHLSQKKKKRKTCCWIITSAPS